MEIETQNETEQEEKKIAFRLAILNICLQANEEVQSKPIPVFLKQYHEQNKVDKQVISKQMINGQGEFFITNYRLLLIIYQKEGTYEEKSMFYQNISNFTIGVPNMTQQVDSQNLSLIQFEKDQNILVHIFLNRLSQQDIKKLLNSMKENKERQSIVPIEMIVKKQILEKDQKLNNFYQQVVFVKKVLTEEQFWNNQEEYQNFIKYKQRDEEKIKRDYIEKEIPPITKEFKQEINIDPVDERISRFNKFRKEIYDPSDEIETQNKKSFQSFKQDIYFYGQIDQEIEKIQQQKKNKNTSQIDEEISIDDVHHVHHLEIEEHSLETLHSDTKKSQPIEMKKEEYSKKISQNPEMEKQKKLEAFLNQKIQSYQKSQALAKEFKEGDLRKLDPKAPNYQELVNSAMKKAASKVQYAFKQAFENLYKLKPLSSNIANSQIAKKCNDIYFEKFYQSREMLRWLYKEKNNGERARPEVVEKLKSELDQIKNSLNEILKSLNENEKKENSDDTVKKVNQQYRERIQDLLDSFMFKQSSA